MPVKEIDWRQLGACRGLDPGIFYPETDEEAESAKAVCGACGVRTACLDTRSNAVRSRACGAAAPSANGGGSSASAAGRPDPGSRHRSSMTQLADLGGWPAVLQQLVGGRDLPSGTARAAMDQVLTGDATPAQVAAFVVALRVKGETVDELNGMLDAMLAAANLVTLPAGLLDRAVDVVGTGGDRSHSINVSTLAALVAAGAGVPVCKHGNRAASSQCGAADLLEALGVAIELSPAAVARCVEEAGIGFCLAPRFHPALRHAGPSRREMGIPTAFNILGPLANPARVRRMLLGVADPSMAERMLSVLQAHGATHVLLVHGHDGLDELTTTGPSTALELRDGTVTRTTVDPDVLGLALAPPEALGAGTRRPTPPWPGGCWTASAGHTVTSSC